MKTFVISAFPGCGKSYCFNNYQDEFSMLDSDSSEFSWIKDENGNKTKERNPDFPNNYIEHIKSKIGKVDIIFVSSHEVVREALAKNNIKTIIVYPSKIMKREWIKRFKERGNDDNFISFIFNNWERFIDNIDSEDYDFLRLQLGGRHKYINANLLHRLIETSMGN